MHIRSILKKNYLVFRAITDSSKLTPLKTYYWVPNLVLHLKKEKKNMSFQCKNEQKYPPKNIKLNAADKYF